jgi:hypothetical protein
MINTGAMPAPLPTHTGVSPARDPLIATLPTPWFHHAPAPQPQALQPRLRVKRLIHFKKRWRAADTSYMGVVSGALRTVVGGLDSRLPRVILASYQ